MFYCIRLPPGLSIISLYPFSISLMTVLMIELNLRQNVSHIEMMKNKWKQYGKAPQHLSFALSVYGSLRHFHFQILHQNNRNQTCLPSRRLPFAWHLCSTLYKMHICSILCLKTLTPRLRSHKGRKIWQLAMRKRLMSQSIVEILRASGDIRNLKYWLAYYTFHVQNPQMHCDRCMKRRQGQILRLHLQTSWNWTVCSWADVYIQRASHQRIYKW